MTPLRLAITLWILSCPVWAHTVNYSVDGKQAVVVTVILGDEEAASFSEYEVFSPDDPEMPFQLGRTDAAGRLAFLPDRAGTWRVKVEADSQHGLHGVQFEVEVGEDQKVKSYNKPLVATHTRLLVGIGILLGLFGLLNLWRRERQ